MPTTEVLTHDGQTVRERKLYTLQELKDEKHKDDEPSDIITSAVGSAYETAMNKVSEMEMEIWEGDMVVEQAVEVLADAGLIAKAKDCSWDISYSQGSMWFALPADTSVDVPRFLRAMKAWASPKGWTALDYVATGKLFPIRASWLRDDSKVKPVDLRTRDYRIMREQGLVVHVRSGHGWSATDEFDELGDSQVTDYYGHYEDVSDEAKSLCNEFLSDLCDWAMRLIRDEYEYCTGDEGYLMETAEANEWLWTKEGRLA